MFVVGGNAHRTVESLSLINWQWNILDPYPKVTDIHSVKTVSHNRSFYVFGGISDTFFYTNNIMRFKNETWSKVGSLITKRVKFSVILITNKIYVIGGQTRHKKELCLISNTVDCEQDFSIDIPGLEEPVLFGVNISGSCNLTIANYEYKESKELMILSSENFKNIYNFVEVQISTNSRIDE